MSTWTRSLRVFGAVALAASLVLAGGSGRVVLANGVGDLYVADPKGVLEVYLKTSTIESPITVPAAPTMLAFTADVYQIAISSLGVTGPTHAATPIVALAHPIGSSLFVAYRGAKTLGVLVDGAATFIDGPTLPASPDILAADPRETRFAAAAKGDTWVAIVEPSSSKVTEVGGSGGIGGKVVAMAVARAEGYVWVATSAPNRVALVSLSTGKVASSAPLDGAPTAITALGKFAVVAVGSSLVKVQAGAASAWAQASGPVLELASDLTASYAYVATADKVTALSVANPKASPAASVAVPNGAPAALAPVPNRGSSLGAAGGGDQGGTGASPGTGNGKSTAHPATKTHAPATDTVLGDGMRISSSDLTTVFIVVGAVIVAVLVGSRLLIKRLVGEK